MSDKIPNLTGLIKELRSKTGVGIMTCKKTLIEADGDLEKALSILKEKGEKVARSKAERSAHEGKVEFITGEHDVALVVVNCETDFVANGPDFTGFAKSVAKIAYDNQVDDLDKLMEQPMGDGTVETQRVALISKIGENIQVSGVNYHKSEGHVVVYNHGVKLACAVFLDKKDETVGKDIGMHVIAMNPVSISSDDVPSDVVERERAVFAAQTEKMGKPEIAEKIIEGKMAKLFKEICLLDQAFVKDTNLSVKEYLKQAGAQVLHFIRVELG